MATGVSDTFTRRFDKEMHATNQLIAMRGLPTSSARTTATQNYDTMHRDFE